MSFPVNSTNTSEIIDCDVFIIGGGVNGAGVARDAAGRGFSVYLCEKNDFGSGTSSASTKLLHGGLRYLEYLEFRLVREALIEREVLLQAMPHISWPMRFILPLHSNMQFEGETPVSRILGVIMPWMKGKRPEWLIRFGLFLYDHIGGRRILPPASTLDLTSDEAGAPLKPFFTKGFEYSDCWVEDSRLVILNLRDARQKGAQLHPHTEVLSARYLDKIWHINTRDKRSGKSETITARMIVNASGPWIDLARQRIFGCDNAKNVRLVRGSHIVVHKKYAHGRSYFFQNADSRIMFAIPYEGDYTLIGTTDVDHDSTMTNPGISESEKLYLCQMASEYFTDQVTPEDIVWTYSGVRPLYDDGVSAAQEATRDYVIKHESHIGDGSLINIFGGKITTYRKLAEAIVEKVESFLGKRQDAWTRGACLPGGDFPFNEYTKLLHDYQQRFDFIEPALIQRLMRLYGTEITQILGDAKTITDLGVDFTHGLYESEVRYLMEQEWASSADDILFRRTKLGIKMNPLQIRALESWMSKQSVSS